MKNFRLTLKQKYGYANIFFRSQLCSYGTIYQIRQHIFKHEQHIIKFSSSIRTSADIFS